MALESVKIAPRFGTDTPEPELYGRVIRDSVAIVESSNPLRRRIFFGATSGADEQNDGLPTQWSAELDRLSSEQEHPRLFITAVGNVDAGCAAVDQYPQNNYSDHPTIRRRPGTQSQSVVTQISRIHPKAYAGYLPLASAGGLSPASCTAVAWTRATYAPVKPDLVLEAGNYAYEPNSNIANMIDDYSLVSTAANFRTSAFTTFGMTSGATALAAEMAGSIAAAFPGLWPETIRALLVHSAEWTPAMRRELANTAGSELDRALFLRRYGYGVPNLQRALWSASNDATMIIQGEMRPFKHVSGSEAKSNELVTYNLPWPKSLLTSLGETLVELKVTLSYFIEPNPARRGWIGRYSYASHGLRFVLKRTGEPIYDYLARINRAERGDDYEGADGSDQWITGRPRNRGSLHSDVWRGRAADLADSGVLSVVPVDGWWRRLVSQRRWDSSCRYALVMSLRTAEASVDLYTAIANAIEAEVGIATTIESQIEI